MTRAHLLSLTASAILITTGAIAQADVTSRPNDDQITDAVKSELIQKDSDIARHVEVTTQDGIVTLSGNALTPQYEANVLRDAMRVDGVVKVKNRLTVD